jgi:3-hydroxymyristoyl/3-hydroxydecanoyl-(acyl carrier protein) dehydratase
VVLDINAIKKCCRTGIHFYLLIRSLVLKKVKIIGVKMLLLMSHSSGALSQNLLCRCFNYRGNGSDRGIAVAIFQREGKLAYFMSIDKAKFRKQVIPGDQLLFIVEVVDRKRIFSS